MATTRVVDSPGHHIEWERSSPPSVPDQADKTTKFSRREPMHGSFADSIPYIMPVGYVSAGYPAEDLVPASFVLHSLLPPALRKKDLEPTYSSLVSIFRAALIPKKHRDNNLFTFNEMQAFRELMWGRVAYECARFYIADGHNERK